ncbi:MAG: hypothetical protein AAB263_13425 [Planctomycetota bacterium]
MKMLCRVGLHQWKFLRPNMFGTACFERCSGCGRGRIFHFAGAYEHFSAEAIAQAIEARSGETEGLDPKDESAVAVGDAPGGQSHD